VDGKKDPGEMRRAADPQERSTGARSIRSSVRRRMMTRQVQVALDIVVLVAASWLAWGLRFEFVFSESVIARCVTQLPMVVLVQVCALVITGVYSFVWRYVDMAELGAFIRAALGSAAVLVLLRLALPSSLAEWRVPLSVVLIDTFLGFGGVLGIRVLRRTLYERFERAHSVGEGGAGRSVPVLLVGAGRAGVIAAKEIQNRRDLGLQVRGFVDDNPEKTGTVIQGVKVLGTARDIPGLVAELGIDHVVITIAKASRLGLRRIVEICEQVPVKARIIPGLFEILDGSVEVSRIRDVQIEDLLGRDSVHLEEEVVRRFIGDKAVMVTGAGGSIGSELVRQVARIGASSLLLVDRAEFALFEIDREVRQTWPEGTVVPLVADVGDHERMRSLMTTYRPGVVIHAAAHKHVPLMESNPGEAVKNNILASRVLGELAGESEVGTFIMISTDKAVRPTSVMGASKRVAELVVQDLNGRNGTRYVSVRFGNVLGSAGSVIPIFRQQILNGGPVTITDPEMVRYFMTIPEAAQLVLQAGAMGEGGEVFILDMGEPVRILDMAKDMIRLYGLKPFEEIDIVFTGIRPGEELFEELETVGESITKTRHPKIFIGKINRYSDQQVQDALARLSELAVNGREHDLRRFLNEFLPEARVAL